VFRRRSRSAALFPLLSILAFVASGCDSILGTNRAEFANNARVIVQGTSGVPLTLVTSTHFAAVPDPDTGDLIASIVTARVDTLRSLPSQHDFDVRGFDRFLARLINPDSAVTATVHMQVLLDGKLVFTQHATMRDASLEFIVFHQR
jgi:hypothetical protein